MPHDDSAASDPSSSSRPRRERSTRYPGVNLAESLKFAGSIDALGVDGMAAAPIAAALGYKNIKTNTFSARLSAARQFGLLNLTDDGYALSPLARAILHPVDPAELPRLHRQALLRPPLYAELAERLAGKRVPEATILGNVLYHHHQIIASAKQAAAEAFLESAQFAGVINEDQVFCPDGFAPTTPAPSPARTPRGTAAAHSAPVPVGPGHSGEAEVRLDLRLWDADRGKTIRLRAPQTMTAASFERFLQALRLLVRIEG
jgi:hypothetical protein